jgi:hypothetical protein
LDIKSILKKKHTLFILAASIVHMSSISSKNSYPNPLSDYFKMMVDQWYSFAINYNQSYITLTESTYDSLCKLFCETMKPMALNMAREYAMRLQEQKEQQGNQYGIPYS